MKCPNYHCLRIQAGFIGLDLMNTQGIKNGRDVIVNFSDSSKKEILCRRKRMNPTPMSMNAIIWHTTMPTKWVMVWVNRVGGFNSFKKSVEI
jgi:hypothetical protein